MESISGTNVNKLIELSEFNPEKVHIKIYKWWIHNQEIRKLHSINRRYSSVMLIIKGTYRYDFDFQTFEANPGDVIYLPHGSVHTYSVISHEAETIQVEFDIFENQTNNSIVFSRFPMLYKGKRNINFFNIFNKDFYFNTADTNMQRSKVISDIFNLLAYMISLENISLPSNDLKQIQAAIEYINDNYTQKIKVSELAEMCFLSESQLRRLFRSKVGMSPIEYKNNLCIKNACNMLRNTDKTIKDIATSLGFGSASFFSRVFTKIKGMSPKQYYLKHKKN